MKNVEVVLAFSSQGITCYEGEGLVVNSKRPIKEKDVLYENFIDVLNSSMRVSYDDSSTDRNTLPAGTVFFDYKSNDTNTGIDVDRKVVGILVRKKRAILLFNDKPLEVAMPNLLFTFSIDKGKYAVTVHVVLDEDVEVNPFVDSVTLKKNYSVYPSVFPNSYSDGRVCWGNAMLPKLMDDNNDFYEVIKTYFLSSFNSDLLDIDRFNVEYLLNTYHSDVKDVDLQKQKGAVYELFLKTIAALDSFDDKLINKIQNKNN